MAGQEDFCPGGHCSNPFGFEMTVHTITYYEAITQYSWLVKILLNAYQVYASGTMFMTNESKSKLRLLLAINTRELKTAFFLALSGQPDMQIVATATNTAELLSYSRTLLPDVTVLEWDLPGRPVVDVFPMLAQKEVFVISKPSSHRQIQEFSPTTKIFTDPEKLIKALDALRASDKRVYRK